MFIAMGSSNRSGGDEPLKHKKKATIFIIAYLRGSEDRYRTHIHRSGYEPKYTKKMATKYMISFYWLYDRLAHCSIQLLVMIFYYPDVDLFLQTLYPLMMKLPNRLKFVTHFSYVILSCKGCFTIVIPTKLHTQNTARTDLSLYYRALR